MKRNSSMDGFVLRRRSQNSDISRHKPNVAGGHNVPERFLIDPTKTASAQEQKASPAPVLRRVTGAAAVGDDALTLPKPMRAPIAFNLDLDDEQAPGKQEKKSRRDKKARGLKKNKNKNPHSRTKKIVMAVSALLVVGLLGMGGYFGYRFLETTGKVFKGNVVGALFSQGVALKQDDNGRTNVLLFGTSEDDPGHPGGDLTDSLMVVSTNQKTHDTFLVSIPRDLHVQYGHACISGYQGKVNVVYSCGKSNNGDSEDAGASALRSAVGTVLGLDIQYSAHVNYTVLKDAVDAVGGITVNIQGDDPRGILDRNFDWICKYKCYYVKYPNGPANLDGTHALYLARARGDDNGQQTYGLSRSNPDREDNQRKILIALKDKAVSAGVLANPVAVNKLLDTLGTNLRTNFDADEVKTLLTVAQKTTNENITSFSLEDAAHPLTTVSCFSGDICPNAGSFNYNDIQTSVKALATGDKASLEHATVGVYNASGTTGLAQTEATKLETDGFTIKAVDTAPTALGTKPISFYDMSNGTKPATLAKLAKELGVKVTSGAPAGFSSSADFVVIVGTPAQSTSSASSSSQ